MDELIAARITIARLKHENATLKKAILKFGKNPAGFDWEVLNCMDENEELRALCLRESLVLERAARTKNNKSMIRVVAASLAEQARKGE